jgi:hypothetical protein
VHALCTLGARKNTLNLALSHKTSQTSPNTVWPSHLEKKGVRIPAPAQDTGMRGNTPPTQK